MSAGYRGGFYPPWKDCKLGEKAQKIFLWVLLGLLFLIPILGLIYM